MVASPVALVSSAALLPDNFFEPRIRGSFDILPINRKFAYSRSMDTLLIQLTNNKAYKLLQDLEDLHLIKLLDKIEKTEPEVVKKIDSAKFRGSLNLNAKQYADFQKHASEIRGEYQDNIS